MDRLFAFGTLLNQRVSTPYICLRSTLPGARVLKKEQSGWCSGTTLIARGTLPRCWHWRGSVWDLPCPTTQHVPSTGVVTMFAFSMKSTVWQQDCRYEPVKTCDRFGASHAPVEGDTAEKSVVEFRCMKRASTQWDEGEIRCASSIRDCGIWGKTVQSHHVLYRQVIESFCSDSRCA